MISKWKFLNCIFVLVGVWVLSLTPEFGFNLSDEKTMVTYIVAVICAAAIGMIVIGVPLLLIGRVLGIIEE